MATKRERVDQVVRAVREFHDLGRRSQSGSGPHGSGATDKEAKRLGVNADHLRKARVFADEEVGYTHKELDALCRAIRDSFDTFAGRNTRFGISHVMRLLSVRKGNGEEERGGVQGRLFAAGWSTAELEAEIRRLPGRRQWGGRQWRAGTKDQLLAQLGSLCASWRRLYAQITDPDADKKPIDTLPTEVRSAVTRAARAVAALHGAMTTAASNVNAETLR